MTDINRLSQDVDRLQEQFIDQAIKLRELRQTRRYAADDTAVDAAQRQLDHTLREWHAAIERLHKTTQRKD